MKRDFSCVKMPLSQKFVQFIPLFHLFSLDLLAIEKKWQENTRNSKSRRKKNTPEKQDEALKDLHLFNETFHTQKCKAPALLLMIVSV